MILYSVILFAAAAVLIAVGAAVYRGKTELIHEYHQTRVKDKKAYGKAMGKALAGTGIPLIAAGIIGLFSASFWPTAVLLAGLVIAFIPLWKVQKKYNGGIF